MENVHLNLARKLVDLLKRKFRERLISVAVFGSVARGEARKDSDIDVLVVIENPPKSRIRRQLEFAEAEKDLENLKDELIDKGYFIDFSPLILSPEEVKNHPPILLDMVEDAIILYDKNDFLRKTLENLKEKLRKLGAKRVRIGKRWYWILKPDYKFGEVIEI
ncbi:DNA polymerase beta domain protein region [Ferroglobus placidus DSM 10642]|uniref:DNA polymerase beta domain protein region n=1 Tax=Ferroglobus placidus (strain DSM 10642 / AEDII12DO) TaxID=589924 RepID=D3S255_FERPA|nr:nucleotidyltransferase domain-containing protein [Ferroglobus placidus]ADC66546.1 DNA polymerase beta domain protein region [Ferroglobus placidus DSM 10642]